MPTPVVPIFLPAHLPPTLQLQEPVYLAGGGGAVAATRCSLCRRDTRERIGLIDMALPIVLLDLFLELDELILDFGIDVPLLLA